MRRFGSKIHSLKFNIKVLMGGLLEIHGAESKGNDDRKPTPPSHIEHRGRIFGEVSKRSTDGNILKK